MPPKQRPILFSGEMVRAILDGRKTQTRRVVKGLEYVGGAGLEHEPCSYGLEDQYGDYHTLPCACPPQFHQHTIRCPYGQPGDLLWVRETWNKCTACNYTDRPDGVLYRADGIRSAHPWRSSIHMPKWACRIWLRVTDVRVERLQKISTIDAKAEGVDAISMEDVPRQATWSQRDDFAQLWDRLNAKRGFGWDVNPWVWIVSFERTDTPNREQ
jgi:hypothetical protein